MVGVRFGMKRLSAWVPLAIVGGALIWGLLGLSYWACHATYSCPSNGCGSVPQTYCSTATAVGVWGIGIVMGALLLFAVISLLRPAHALPA